MRLLTKINTNNIDFQACSRNTNLHACSVKTFGTVQWPLSFTPVQWTPTFGNVQWPLTFRPVQWTPTFGTVHWTQTFTPVPWRDIWDCSLTTKLQPVHWTPTSGTVQWTQTFNPSSVTSTFRLVHWTQTFGTVQWTQTFISVQWTQILGLFNEWLLLKFYHTKKYPRFKLGHNMTKHVLKYQISEILFITGLQPWSKVTSHQIQISFPMKFSLSCFNTKIIILSHLLRYIKPILLLLYLLP